MKNVSTKKGDVVFRRIGGRVVPIRVNRDQSQAKGTTPMKASIGTAAIASAGAAAVAAGNIASRFQIAGAHAERVARKTILRNPGRHLKLMKLAGKLHKLRNVALLGGGLVGGALATAGTHLLGVRQGKTKTAEGITAPVGFGTSLLLGAAAYYFKIGQPKTLAGIRNALNLARRRPTIQYTLKGI